MVTKLKRSRCHPGCPDYKKPKKRSKHLFLVAFVYGGNLQDMSIVNEKRLRAAVGNDDWAYHSDNDISLDDTIKFMKNKYNVGNSAVFTSIDGDNECKIVYIGSGINKQTVLL